MKCWQNELISFLYDWNLCREDFFVKIMSLIWVQVYLKLRIIWDQARLGTNKLIKYILRTFKMSCSICYTEVGNSRFIESSCGCSSCASCLCSWIVTQIQDIINPKKMSPLYFKCMNNCCRTTPLSHYICIYSILQKSVSTYVDLES